MSKLFKYNHLKLKKKKFVYIYTYRQVKILIDRLLISQYGFFKSLCHINSGSKSNIDRNVAV